MQSDEFLGKHGGEVGCGVWEGEGEQGRPPFCWSSTSSFWSRNNSFIHHSLSTWAVPGASPHP